MWFLTEVGRSMEGAESAFRWASGLVDDVPLLGDRLKKPFERVAGWLDLAGYNLRETSRSWDRQADDIRRNINDVGDLILKSRDWLPWHRIHSNIRAYFPVLRDPIGFLWPQIYNKIRDIWPEMRNFRRSVSDLARDYLKANVNWIYSPINYLFPKIDVKLGSKYPWFKDPHLTFWNYTKDQFTSYFWTFLDIYGEKFLDKLGVIIDRFWYGTEDPE